MSVQLYTLGRGKPFTFTGTTTSGTTINYGAGNSFTLSASDWASVLIHFSGKVAPLGADFAVANRAPGSIGEFLIKFTPTSIATYLAAILIHENRAQVVSPPQGATVGGVWVRVF